jgi:hypothetical protein
MSPLLIMFMLTAAVGLASLCTALVLALRLKRLKRQMQNDHRSLPATATRSKDHAAFQAPLLQATLKQRLQQNHSHRPTPDKYKMAAAMATQGMTAQQIADLLMLPPAEVRQLIRLSRAGRPEPPAPLSAAPTAYFVDGTGNEDMIAEK